MALACSTWHGLNMVVRGIERSPPYADDLPAAAKQGMEASDFMLMMTKTPTAPDRSAPAPGFRCAHCQMTSSGLVTVLAGNPSVLGHWLGCL